MKKTVLVLGCLLAIGFSSVSCNRDDGMPETQVVVTNIQRSDLPKRMDHYLSTILGDAQVYDNTAGYNQKNKPNPYAATPQKTYLGESVTSVTKQSPADATTGAIYHVVLSNGVKLGFKENEFTQIAYVDGNGAILKEAAWADALPGDVQTSVRALGTPVITDITKIEVSTANVYTITFLDGTVKKYNADGPAA